MKAEFKWNKTQEKITEEAAGGKEGMIHLASTAARFMDGYIPADNLNLAQDISVTADADCGHVTYNSPYAHYQYEGILYVDPKTGKGAFTDGEGRFWSRPGVAKIKTDKKLTHSKFRHPLATSHWDKAMMTARKNDLAKDYENYLKGL